MNHLRRLTRSDRHQLGQVDLECAGVVAQHQVKRIDDGRVGDQGASGWRAGDKGAGALSGRAQELGVATAGGHEVGLDLFPYPIHRLGGRKVGNDYTPVFAERLSHLCR